MIDPTESEYLDGWVDERGDKHEGMRSRETKKRNGIWRFVTAEYSINEGSSKYGQAHGLVREISKSRVTYALCKDGNCVSQIGFDKNMVQIWKIDPQNLLADIMPEKISRQTPR